ncbi:ATP-binding cassette domain-containing protein [Gammaproteobacteria bacterium]|nr:ATP-binding cassette domain-containing protein [Gammaproteobacteria bacterium]
MNTHWFWGKVFYHKAIFWRVGMAGAMINFFSIASSIFIMVVYDRVIPNGAFSSLYALTIGMLIVLLFDFILRNLRAWFIDFAGFQIDRTVGKDIYESVLSSYSSRNQVSVGGLANTIKDFDLVKEFFTSASMALVIDLPFILLFIGVIYLIAGPLAVVPLVMVPLVIGVGFLVQPILNKIGETLLSNTKSKHSVVVESLSGLETIRSTGSHNLFTDRYQKAIDESSDLSRRSKMLSQLSLHTATSAQQLSLVLIIFYGTFLIYSGDLSMGAMIAAVLLSSRCLGPLAQIASLFGRLHSSKSAFNKLDILMEECLGANNLISSESITPMKLGDIDIKNLTFGYEKDQECIQGLNLKIKSGERIAILGKNGSGKSTLLKLLSGLLEANHGAIMFSGLPLSQIDKKVLNKNIAIQLQDIHLFSGSLKDNIFLSRTWIDEGALSNALDISGVSNFLHMLPGGLDAQLSDRGMSLSGGQRQSVALARTLISGSEIIILDEPTASMDLNSEQMFTKKISEDLKATTLIVATHRLPVVNSVDRVIVLADGRVVLDEPQESAMKKLIQKPKD